MVVKNAANLVPAETWDGIVQHVRSNSSDIARGWFAALRPVSLDIGELIVEAENTAQVQYLEEHCRRAFGRAAQAITGRLVTARFLTSEVEPQSRPFSFAANGRLALANDNVFENFVVGPCNRLAHAAAVAAAANPGTAYNPLFIHGDVGLGKTHLLQAICHGIRSARPDANLLYISCESFINDFIEAVERGALHDFRFCYRHADVLVIDDIQFLAERERSQEEFFHTFNTLHQSQRQIVLSADCSPGEIPSLENRLVSRFNSGLVALVDRPCFETRMAIIRTKMKLRCIEIPEDVVKLIASRIDSNVREIEGAIARLDLLSHANGGRIDVDLANEVLGVVPQVRTVAIPNILDLIAKRYNLRISDLQGKRRTKSVVFPRQLCMYLAREMTPASLEEIGGYFGGRDHTTVIHAHRQVGQRRAADTGLEAEIQNIEAALLSGS